MRNIKGIINRHRDLFNLFQLFGETPPFPLLILSHLTLACQCACEMCYQRAPGFPHRGEEWMSESLFDALLCQSRRFLRRPLIHLYGGEPLLHPGLPEILALLERRGFAATLNTNGEHLEERAALLARSRIRMINVSLDGIGDAHDALRRRAGLFDHAVAGIQALRARDPRVHLNINYVVNPTNVHRIYEDLLGFERLVRGTRIDYLSIEHLAFTRGMLPFARGIDAALLRRELSRVRRHRFAFPVSATPVVKDRDLERYYGSLEPLGRENCNVPWIALNVFPDGDVTPGGAMFTCTQVVGNLGEEEIFTIWNGEPMRAFRRRIRTAMPEDCMRCCHTLHDSPVITCRPADRTVPVPPPTGSADQ